jgi:DNA-binding NtrC family response regulator
VSKPCPLDELEMRLAKALERRALAERNQILEAGLTPPNLSGDFVGRSSWHEQILAQIARFGPADASVLVLGETGTGKDVVAKMIHAASPRRERPFVVVDCASLNENLLQSELFGHEKGAFTGATRDKHGLFEVADRGTIFLDEVGDMSPAIQAKLLRVLETSTFRRVGGTDEIRVDVRIIAATNLDLLKLGSKGLFRQDLYFRLSTIQLALAPLRNRREDLQVIARHCVARYNARFGRALELSAEAVAVLERYAWPGNVRELFHVVEQAMILADGPVVGAGDLPDHVRHGGPAPAPASTGPLPTLEELEREHVARVLAATGGHRGQAARILGISERNLYRMLRNQGQG